ncbi:Squalene/phytoene synthase [Beggiatoa sp. SS]|nr:Squalene/phytoene synthase [Beggiatoa sp. SS]
MYSLTHELEQFKVSPHTLYNDQLSDSVQALLTFQTKRIRDYNNNAFKYLAKEDRFNQRSGLIRAQIALATLQEIEKEKYQVFEHRIHLTPLRKLWITWRTNWQARR